MTWGSSVSTPRFTSIIPGLKHNTVTQKVAAKASEPSRGEQDSEAQLQGPKSRQTSS